MVIWVPGSPDGLGRHDPHRLAGLDLRPAVVGDDRLGDLAELLLGDLYIL